MAQEPAVLTETTEQPAKTGERQDVVMVKPLRFYQDSEKGHKTPDDEPYEVSRFRAAELRSNGLVEYANPKDEEVADKTEVDQAADRARDGITARRARRSI